MVYKQLTLLGNLLGRMHGTREWLADEGHTGLKNDQDRWTLYERGRDALLNWKQSSGNRASGISEGSGWGRHAFRLPALR